MRNLLLYNSNGDFVADQVAAGGDGTKVISSVDAVAWAWTGDGKGNAYYRYAKPTPENTTIYTVTVKYMDISGNTVFPNEIFNIESYTGTTVEKTFHAKSVKDGSLVSSCKECIISVSGDTEFTFVYYPKLEADNQYPFNYQPLTFIVTKAGTITWKKQEDKSSYGFSSHTISYSKNGGSWTTIASNDVNPPTINVSVGDIVKFRGNNNAYGGYTTEGGQGGTDYWYWHSFFGGTASFEVFGNIMSLIDSVNYSSIRQLYNYGFYGLFMGCTGLTGAKYLSLSLYTSDAYSYSYWYMFSGCCNLLTAPKYIKSTLSQQTCSRMFSDCTNLLEAPEELTLNISNASCQYMFNNCKNLKSAPVLPAKVLQTDCYYGMFNGCTKLKYVKALFNTTPGASYTGNWLYGVSTNGTFVKSASATWDESITRGASTVPENWTIENET